MAALAFWSWSISSILLDLTSPTSDIFALSSRIIWRSFASSIFSLSFFFCVFWNFDYYRKKSHIQIREPWTDIKRRWGSEHPFVQHYLYWNKLYKLTCNDKIASSRSTERAERWFDSSSSRCIFFLIISIWSSFDLRLSLKRNVIILPSQVSYVSQKSATCRKKWL